MILINAEPIHKLDEYTFRSVERVGIARQHEQDKAFGIIGIGYGINILSWR